MAGEGALSKLQQDWFGRMPADDLAAVQQKMLRARVTIIGAGALGGWAAELLARMGLGRMRLLDRATVQKADLNQHAAVTEEDIDRAKVTVIADRVAAINSRVLLETFPVELQPEQIDDFLVGSDLVLDTTGDSTIRGALFASCCQHGLHYVGCEANTVSARIVVWRGTDGETFLPLPLDRSRGRFPAVASLAASLAVQESIKLLCGTGESLAGQIVTLDTGKNKWACDPLAGATETLDADGNGESH